MPPKFFRLCSCPSCSALRTPDRRRIGDAAPTSARCSRTSERKERLFRTVSRLVFVCPPREMKCVEPLVLQPHFKSIQAPASLVSKGAGLVRTGFPVSARLHELTSVTENGLLALRPRLELLVHTLTGRTLLPSIVEDVELHFLLGRQQKGDQSPPPPPTLPSLAWRWA